MPVLEALNGVTLHPVEFRRPADLAASFATIKSEHADALVTFSDPLTYVNAKQSLNWKPFAALYCHCGSIGRLFQND